MRNPYDWIGRVGLLLAIVGAVNWLLVGLFEWNLVRWIFTDSATQTATTGERIVYIVVGIGGLLAVPMLAATLARARSRDLRGYERPRDRSELNRNDTEFYLGGSKESTEPVHGERQAMPAGSRSLHAEGRPLQSEERTPLRAVETTPGPVAAAGASSFDTSEDAGDRLPADDRLRHGRVEETGEGLGDEARVAEERGMPAGERLRHGRVEETGEGVGREGLGREGVGRERIVGEDTSSEHAVGHDADERSEDGRRAA